LCAYLSLLRHIGVLEGTATKHEICWWATSSVFLPLLQRIIVSCVCSNPIRNILGKRFWTFKSSFNAAHGVLVYCYSCGWSLKDGPHHVIVRATCLLAVFWHQSVPEQRPKMQWAWRTEGLGSSRVRQQGFKVVRETVTWTCVQNPSLEPMGYFLQLVVRFVDRSEDTAWFLSHKHTNMDLGVHTPFVIRKHMHI
jgi:hypothetical protein